MNEWQPIETAPKDGTWFLGWQQRDSAEDQVEVWKWWESEHDYGAHWVNAPDSSEEWEAPTHWMPLPEAPKMKPCPLCGSTRHEERGCYLIDLDPPQGRMREPWWRRVIRRLKEINYDE